MALRVQHREIDASSPDTVVINSSDLVNHLIKEQDKTMAVLKQAAPSVSVHDVSVDASGKVIIKNKDFANQMRQLVKNAPANLRHPLIFTRMRTSDLTPRVD